MHLQIEYSKNTPIFVNEVLAFPFTLILIKWDFKSTKNTKLLKSLPQRVVYIAIMTSLSILFF